MGPGVGKCLVAAVGHSQASLPLGPSSLAGLNSGGSVNGGEKTQDEAFEKPQGETTFLAPEILEQGHGTHKRKLNTFEKEFLTDLGQHRTVDHGAQSDHVYSRTSHCELGSVRSAKT